MVLGFAFLGAELFVIPGFGISGILGIASLVAGVALAWVKYGSMWGLVLLGLSLLLTLVAVVVLMKSRVGKRLVLEGSLEGAVAVSAEEGERLLGAVGMAVTMLRPSGSAEFGEARVEVETNGEYIPKGARVRVVAVKLGRVVVEAAPDEAGHEQPTGER
jgi:membrane-bound serine protease (ClpP class)